MTTYSKSSLKTFFESGDVPQGGDYANLIDSYINVVETTAQTMAGSLFTTKLITPFVSAAGLNITGTLSAQTLSVGLINGVALSGGGVTGASNGSFTGTVSAAAFVANSINIATTSNLAAVSATNINVATNISASGTIFTSALRITGGVYGQNPVPIVSAAGTTQGAATALPITPVIRGQGTADGATTGFALPANQTGMIQYFYHEGTVSGNLWPPTGGNINALANNAAFPLVASTLYTIIHKSASAYAVK